MKPTKQDDIDVFGDPTTSPFVRFQSGWSLYPPNSLYECGQIVSEKLATNDFSTVFNDLVEKGDCGGSYTILPRSTWFAVLGTFFHYRAQPDDAPSSWREVSVAALKLMLRRPHQAGWSDLKRFLKGNIDEISGWTSSWKRSLAEQHRIFRGDDDRYYRHDEDGILIRVIGEKTLEETRIDFITDQVLRGYGFARQFLELFGLFSIADDFARDPSAYPPAMKAIVGEPEYRLGHTWHFMYHERTRSLAWRPNSNMCDPNWLASDLLASMTDTLKVDYFKRRIDTRKPDDSWTVDPCRFQVEYVIDSMIRIGHAEEAYIEFEGKTFRWINGTTERDAVVVVPVRDLNDTQAEVEKLNRLLSAIVWEHKHHIRKLWGMGGPRKPYPSVYGPRMSFGIIVEPYYLAHFTANKSISDAEWLALALFREAVNSESKFYAFLCYYKILDIPFEKNKDRTVWINNVAPTVTREKERVNEILKNTTDLEEYLRQERVNAIKHVLHRPALNPDDPRDEFKVTVDLDVMKDLARLAIEMMLK
jgi:Methylamine utilization protein MauJ